MKRDPTILEVFAQRALQIKSTAFVAFAPNRNDVLEALRELGHRLSHFPNFVFGQIIKAFIG